MLGVELIVTVENMIIGILLFEFFEEEPVPNSDLLGRRGVFELVDITFFVVYIEGIEVV